MNIAAFFKASAQHISKESFKRQHPAPYCSLILRHGFYYLYTSQEPSYALAEAWLKQRGDTEAQWGLLQPLEDGRFFFMFAHQGDIIKAQVGTLEQLDAVLLARCITIYAVDIPTLPTGDHQGLLNYSLTSLAPLLDNELAPFALKKANAISTKAIATVLLGALLVAVGLFAFLPSKKAPDTLPSPVDPYLAYRTTVTSTYSASAILQQVFSLGAYGVTLPYGWQLKNVSLQNDNVSLIAERIHNGQRAVMTTWLNQHPQLKPYGVITLDTLTINVPLHRTLRQWQNKIMPVEPSLSSVVNAQVALGWTITEPVSDNGIVSITSSWTASKETALSELLLLRQMVSALPVTLTEIEITPNHAVGMFTFHLRFAFIGQKK